MSSHRRISQVFGALYLITFVTSIAAALLYQPLLDDPQGYIAGDGSDSRIYLGALLELFLIIANIGTAIVLIPLLKRQHESSHSATSRLASWSASSSSSASSPSLRL